MGYHHLSVVITILAGVLFRLIWPADMEWKTDEKLLYELAHTAADSGSFPESGIKSGGGIVNPGLSVGLFAVIARFTDTPVGMVRVVQWVNLAALIAFLLLGLRLIQGPEREVWVMGLALAAVNPLAVIFSRKIWAQDLMPMLAFLVVLGHSYRHRPFGAFCWGLMSALLGQVHMSGFFYAFGLFALTVLHDRAQERPFHWVAWVVGSALGAAALIPWLMIVVSSGQATTTSWVNLFQLNFFFYWLIDPLGLDLMYSLRDEFWPFLKEPRIGGVPTYIVGLLHLVLTAGTLVAVRRLLQVVPRLGRKIRVTGWKGSLTGLSFMRLHYVSMLLGLGILMPLTGVTIYQHYLICTFPFAFVFIAQLLHPYKRMMYATVVAQLILTTIFLWYVHRNGGAPNGDYGPSYAAQAANTEVGGP